MTAGTVVDLVREAMWMTFWLSLPLLAVGFVAGVTVSLLQIVTSIQDTTFGAVPRLAAFLAALVIFLPWMLSKAMGYAQAILGDLARYAR